MIELHCLDAYPDGTPRLRLPASKNYTERTVPITEEAAEAIQALRLDTIYALEGVTA